jgi:hypothetical protein
MTINLSLRIAVGLFNAFGVESFSPLSRFGHVRDTVFPSTPLGNHDGYRKMALLSSEREK